MKSINAHLKTVVVGVLATSLLSIGFVSFAADIKLSKAERVGMSSERLSKIDEMSKRYIEQGNYSGIVTLVARKGKVVHLSAHGNYGVDNATPMAPDTLFRIYSMTKPVTAIAALMLHEEGKFQMNDPVSKYLPEFEYQKLLIRDEKNTTMLVNPKSEMTMRQLFTHTAGLTYGTTLDNDVDLSLIHI